MKLNFSTITNLSYLFAGIPLFWSDTATGFFCCTAMTFLAVSSWMAHMTEKQHWWRADNQCMWAALMSILILQIGFWWLIPIAIGLSALSWIKYDWIHSRVKIPLGVITINGSYLIVAILFGANIGMLYAKDWLWATLTLATFALAFAYRQIGEIYYKLDTDMSHGLWHIITGIGFFMMVRLYI